MDSNSPVREVMTSEVVTFGPDDTVEHALRTLVDSGVDAAPVLDGDRVVVGVLSSADLVVKEAQLHLPRFISVLGASFELGKRSFDAELEKALGSTVAQLMSDDPVTCRPDDTIEAAASLIHDRHVSRLPVTDGSGKLVGIVSRHDILRAILEGGSAAG
ncbi:MAG: CBS domain-containing protein [Acidimicrobiales bacterium]